jgi:hypothetical protein
MMRFSLGQEPGCGPAPGQGGTGLALREEAARRIRGPPAAPCCVPRASGTVRRPEVADLDESLLARAMEHDSPTSLFRPPVHSTGQNSPLLSPGAAGLLKQVTSPAARLERPATRLFEVSRWGHLAWLADQGNRTIGELMDQKVPTRSYHRRIEVQPTRTGDPDVRVLLALH